MQIYHFRKIVAACFLSYCLHDAVQAQVQPNYTELFRRKQAEHLNIDRIDFFKDIYYPQLGYFCKLELHGDKRRLQPIRFRLGNVQYVDKLEGKGCYKYQKQ